MAAPQPIATAGPLDGFAKAKNYTFIDYALAVMALKRRWEAEQGEAMSMALVEFELADKIGHPISRRDLGRMFYASNVLWPAIPNLLKAGAGPTFVDKIGRLDTAYRDVYAAILDAWTPESPVEFDKLFADQLALHDDPKEGGSGKFQADRFQQGLCLRIEQITGHRADMTRLLVIEQMAQKSILPRNPPKVAPPPNQQAPATSAEKPHAKAAATAPPSPARSHGHQPSPLKPPPSPSRPDNIIRFPDESRYPLLTLLNFEALFQPDAHDAFPNAPAAGRPRQWPRINRVSAASRATTRTRNTSVSKLPSEG